MSLMTERSVEVSLAPQTLNTGSRQGSRCDLRGLHGHFQIVWGSASGLSQDAFRSQETARRLCFLGFLFSS